MPTTRGTRDDAEIVLSGPPGQLRATVTIENTSGAKLSVRAPTLHLEGHASVVGSGAAQIAPGATVAVPVVFRLDAAMPPGRYAGELELGGQRRAVAVDVSPLLSLRVSPDRLLADPGPQPVTLVVANNGNVRMPLSSLTLARTDDGRPGSQTKEDSPDVSLVLDEPGAIEPGQSRSLTGRLEVPDDLDPARRHTAVVPVGVADLTVIILPRIPSETNS